MGGSVSETERLIWGEKEGIVLEFDRTQGVNA